MEKHRGHPMEKVNGKYVYKDTRQLVSENPNRSCGYCGLSNTPEGHDGCLGTLPNLMNACCGHGNIRQTYAQFVDGTSINGEEAEIIIATLKSSKNNSSKGGEF